MTTLVPVSDRDERTLLRELTHRINNELLSSINIVSAAVVRTENPEVKVALSNVVDLLQQHADLHRILTIPDPAGLVDAAEYIRKLGLAMSRCCLEPMGIRLALVADTLPLESERCWRLALAVYELVTNAARHAFFEGRDGEIKIKLSLADQAVNCIVADNGSLSARLKSARGLQIVSDLTKTLGGRIGYFFGAQSSSFLLAFPLTDASDGPTALSRRAAQEGYVSATPCRRYRVRGQRDSHWTLLMAFHNNYGRAEVACFHPPTTLAPSHGNVMKRRSPACLLADQVVSRSVFRSLNAVVAVAVLAMPLSACNDHSTLSAERAAFVRTEIVEPRDRQAAVTLTGEVQARFSADLSFRVSGRVLERLVDVGAHVKTDDVLARLDPAEQQADLDATTAGVAAAESQLRVAKATFDRQSYLISSGFTTSTAYDQAKEGLRSAESTLESAKSQLGQAREALGDAELHARASGVITARNFEVGQVVQSAQSVFTLAQDGDRDAVFDVPESTFFGDVESGRVSLTLVSDPQVTAVGYVREISPAVDPKSLTVRVKVAIQNLPDAMTLGSAIAGTAGTKAATEIALPWTALMATGSQPAVWIVDPKTKTTSLKPVSVAGYESGAVLIKGGLEAGDRVVVDGGKLLSSGQPVTYGEDRS